MNSKKLLALLCATAMASSTLVPVISASADETTTDAAFLWSDTFDLYENYTYGVGGLSTILTLAASTVGAETYTGVPGADLQVCTRGGGDDTSYFLVEAVEEGSEDLALKTSISRFSTESRGSRITFENTYAPEGENALVLATKIKMDVAEENTYAPAFRVGNIVVTSDMLGTENTWVELKVAYYPDSTYEVLVDNALVGSGTATSTSIDMNFSALDATGALIPGSSSAKASAYHTIWLDDMVVYNAADPYAAAPEAVSQTPEVLITPSPSPAPEAAPSVTVPEGAQTVAEQNFNASTAVTYNMKSEGTDVTEGDIRFTIGSRSDGDSSTYVSITENVADDKMLRTVDGTYATAGRDIKLYLVNDVKAADLDASGYASFSFAANLQPSGTQPATINFLSRGTEDVLETLTTDENATSGIIVPSYEWILVEYIMYPDGEVYVSVNGQDTLLSTKSTSLPDIRMHDGSTTAVKSTVDYDNFLVYVEGPYIHSTPTPEPTVPPVAAAEGTKTVLTQDMNSVDPKHSNYFGSTAVTCTDIEGITYYIGSRADGANGSTTNVRIETDSYENQYIYAETNKYGANGRAPRFEITGAPVLANLATDEDYVAASFAAKLIPYGTTPATLVFPMTSEFSTNGNKYVFNAGTLTTEEGTETSVPANEWLVIDVKVYKTGAYEISVNGEVKISGQTVGSATNPDSSDKMTLTALPLITTNDCENDTNASFAIDNLVVYHTGDLVAVVTPAPTPEPVAAPGVSAADNTTVVFAENFNGLEASTTRMSQTEALTVEVGPNLTATMGYREGESSNEAHYTAVTVKENVEADNVLNLTGGKFGTITRAPKVTVVNSPDASALAEDNYIAMGFAFKLNSVSSVTDQISALTLIANPDDTVVLDEEGNNTNTETKNEGNVYGYVYGTVTTNEADVEEGSVVYAEPDVWHTAEVFIYSDGEWFVSIDGVDVFTGNGLAYSNGDKVPTTKLPSLVPGKNVKDTKTYPSVDIDNMVVYTSEAPADVNVEIESAAADTVTIAADGAVAAKVIVASYDESGRLVSAKTQIENLVQGQNTVAVSAAAGDTVMVWTAYNNSGMKALGKTAKVQ